MTPMLLRPPRRRRLTVVATVCLAVSALVADPAPGAVERSSDARVREFAGWIQQMKSEQRGPFLRIRWFCADGTIHPPRPYPCKERGGGVQHGELDQRAKALREAGYQVANVLADLDRDALLEGAWHRDRLAQLLLERFLIEIDDGWILRRARFYRGALQDEDERKGAETLLLALVSDDARVVRDFAMLRAAARLLPHGVEDRSASEVRQLSAALSDRDPSFLELRNKIHAYPTADDAAAVRRHMQRVDDPQLLGDYRKLADAIERLYSSASIHKTLDALSARVTKHPTLQDMTRRAADALGSQKSEIVRYRTLARLMLELRDALTTIKSANIRLAVIDVSLLAEAELFVSATRLRETLGAASRSVRLELLDAAVDAAYGAALLSPRQLSALRTALSELDRKRPTLERYKSTLDRLSLVPAWSQRRLRFHFGTAIDTLGALEPKAHRYIEDALRGSPLFFYAQVLEALARDANQLAGVRHALLGDLVGSGVRALNPGLARGLLLPAPQAGAAFDPQGIYILPETESDLPPVAGIITAGEGNPLSHVQLLARNLGIPNVGVDEALLTRLAPMHRERVVLAVSPAGSVQLARHSSEHDALFAAGPATADAQALIRPDLEKLNLAEKRLRALSELRAEDSGRTVGPKAAKLGELKHSYPEAVAEGLAVPFGVFRSLLERRYKDTGASVFEWMQASYRHLETLPAQSQERREETERFRSALHDWVLESRLDEEFSRQLRARMREVFGNDGDYGVFVRSDTNVEDLPGFTGAGLNLTVPNVVGVDAIIAAIPKVWASPFTARAFAWRQSHMDQPEHVYPAVLLLRSVNAEKSGVLVTRDIDSGDDRWLSVAVNEGVGGAVDGQAAESLRIAMDGSEVRLLAQATAPVRRQINPRGGVDKLPASGSDHVLTQAEIRELIALAETLPRRFPAIVDADSRAAPADIEFGFLDGRLQLFQIRPFLESRQARSNAYLKSLDADMKRLDEITVNLEEAPQ